MSDHDCGDDRKDPVGQSPHGDRAEAAGNSYQVGYGRPPIDRRFKPGQSGNPKGRPRGSRNAKAVVAGVMNEKVPVRANGKRRKMTKFEVALQAIAQKAMQGDARALNTLIGIMAKTSQFDDTETETSTTLPEDDAGIIADFVRRQSGDARSGREVG
jgi:Family of unknown function (DUF5681)